MKKIAVMGAGGFVGSSLCGYLRQKYEVLPVTRKEIDLLDATAVERFLEKEHPEVVINCANQGGNRKVEAAGGKADVIGNNLKMFFAQEQCIGSGMKMINFGSGAQYGKNRNLVKVREEEFGSVIPADDYGYSKYVMERYIRTKNEAGGSIYNPAIFGLYGAGEDYTFKFISNAIIKNIIGMPIVINQNVVFDYLWLEDFLNIIGILIEKDCPNKEFNITPTESVDLVTIAGYINDCGAQKSEIIVKNSGMNFRYTGDNGKLLQNVGGTFAFTPYRVGVEKLYRYYEAHMDGLDLETIKKDELLKWCRTNR